MRIGCLGSLSLSFFLLLPHLLSYNVAHSCHIILSEDPSFISEDNSITWFSSSVAVSYYLSKTDPFFPTTNKGTNFWTLHLLLFLFSLFFFSDSSYHIVIPSTPRLYYSKAKTCPIYCISYIYLFKNYLLTIYHNILTGIELDVDLMNKICSYLV